MMRNATPSEIQDRTEWNIEVTFDNPNKPNSKPCKRLGPYIGGTEADVRQQALTEAQGRWKQGINHRITEVESCPFDSEGVFFWDWKQSKAVGHMKFFEKLDAQLGSLEIVHIPFDGDDCPWFIGERQSTSTSS